jgi:hypothetical protein
VGWWAGGWLGGWAGWWAGVQALHAEPHDLTQRLADSHKALNRTVLGGRSALKTLPNLSRGRGAKQSVSSPPEKQPG